MGEKNDEKGQDDCPDHPVGEGRRNGLSRIAKGSNLQDGLRMSRASNGSKAFFVDQERESRRMVTGPAFTRLTSMDA